MALLDQSVQECMTHLNEKYERLSVNYKELQRVVMEMRSQMDDTCTPSCWSCGTRNDQPPHSLLFPAPPLF
jgi:hypothetical protein